MSIYYSDDHVTLYHGDCLTEHREWLDADVLVTDPPYGIGWSSRAGWKSAKGTGGHRSSGMATGITGDSNTEARDAALTLWGDKPAIVFGDILKPPETAIHALIYAKPIDAGIRGACAGRRKDVEGIYLMGAWPRGIGGETSIIRTAGLVAGPRGISMRAGHPHAKPQDVMGELVALSRGVIADPFAGSGSTLIAAKAAGRKAVGIELDEVHCETAARRCQQEVLDIFGGMA